MSRSPMLRRRARPPKMPTWTHRAFGLGRLVHGRSFNGEVVVGADYAKQYGPAISLKRQARRDRARRTA